MEEVQRLKGKDWERVRAAELSPEMQKQLANLVLDTFLYSAMMGYIERTEPYWWLAFPETGYFTLEGEVGPGNHPLLRFCVPRPDGKIDTWGWAVGTSSLD